MHLGREKKLTVATPQRPIEKRARRDSFPHQMKSLAVSTLCVKVENI